MFSGLLSASAWYVDVAIVIVLALFLVGGLIKGFAKSTKGFFVFVVIICASALLMGVTQEAAMEGSLGKNITESISVDSSGWGVAFNNPVTYDGEGKPYVVVEGNAVELSGGEFGFKGTMAKFYATRFGVPEGESVAAAAVGSLAGTCVSAVLFLIYVAGFLVVFFVLRLVLKPVEDSDSVGIKITDRLLGALLRLFIGLVIVWAILAIAAAIGGKVDTVDNFFRGSAIGGFFYEHNPLTTAFDMIFG